MGRGGWFSASGFLSLLSWVEEGVRLWVGVDGFLLLLSLLSWVEEGVRLWVGVVIVGVLVLLSLLRGLENTFWLWVRGADIFLLLLPPLTLSPAVDDFFPRSRDWIAANGMKWGAAGKGTTSSPALWSLFMASVSSE